MENLNRNLLKEDVSDEVIKSIYTNALKKNGVPVKKFNIKHDKSALTYYFQIILPIGIHFWIKWSSDVSTAYVISIFRDKQSPTETITNPSVQSVVDVIRSEYKKIMKGQNILKHLIALILEGSGKNSNQNPMLNG